MALLIFTIPACSLNNYLTFVSLILLLLQILMSVLIIMARVPMTVSIRKVVIIVNALLDTFFNLTIILAKVNICSWWYIQVFKKQI